MRFLALALLVGIAGCTRAGKFPDHPILLICPWAAGGGTDTVSRQVAFLLERELGVPVNVQNATGGGGVTGHSRGALARPDGYTLTMMTVELNMLHWRGMTSIRWSDFAPLVLLNRDAPALFVRADAPWKSVAEVQAHARELKASGTARGAIWHLALAGWLQKAGMKPDDMIWVPNNGAKPSLQALVAAGVDVVCCSVPEARAELDGRLVRCLGVMASARLEDFPEFPTFKEQGTDWTCPAWRGIGVPKDTPREVREALAAALERVVRGEEFLKFMRTQGFNAACEPPAEFEKTLERVDAELGAMLTSEAFKGMAHETFGPMFFPAVLGLLLAVVVAALAFTGGFRREAGAGAERAGVVRFIEVLAALAIYLVAAEPLGFLLTAGILVFVLLWRFGTRPVVSAAVTLILVPAVYQLFAIQFRVPLPYGLLGW